MWNIKKIISKGDYFYALVPEHPFATSNGYVLYHRIVMENHLKKILSTDEVVHHLDENKKNNDINNLKLMTKQEHSKHHKSKGRLYVKLKCPWCHRVFELPKNKSFLKKPSKYNCNCCSNSCRGKLYRAIQLQGLTLKLENAISENLLAEYRKYYIDEDNSEETFL